MKKIAVLNCLKANEVCTGAACLRAFADQNRHFSVYQGEAVQLAAFMRCNGCGHTIENDPGLREKLERLISEEVETVHVGVCTQIPGGTTCEYIQQMMDWLTKQGISVVCGTH